MTVTESLDVLIDDAASVDTGMTRGAGAALDRQTVAFVPADPVMS